MEHAVVRVYDARSYKIFGEPLQGHILTVTRISFSPDDKLILTVSRDRTWRLFEAQNENGKYAIILYCYCLQYSKNLVQAIFQLLLKRLMLASSGIADGRMKAMYSQQRHVTRRYIDCSYRSSSQISSLRVIQVKIWSQNGGKWKVVSTLTAGQPATAVAFTSLKKNKRFVSSLVSTLILTAWFIVGDILPLGSRVEKS